MRKRRLAVIGLGLVALLIAVPTYAWFYHREGAGMWLAFVLAPGLLISQTVAQVIPNWAIWLVIGVVQVLYFAAIASLVAYLMRRRHQPEH
jgi:hypothetical protein